MSSLCAVFATVNLQHNCLSEGACSTCSGQLSVLAAAIDAAVELVGGASRDGGFLQLPDILLTAECWVCNSLAWIWPTASRLDQQLGSSAWNVEPLVPSGSCA